MSINLSFDGYEGGDFAGQQPPPPRTAFAAWFKTGKPDPVNELVQSAAACHEPSA